jgi:hypothetical protein
MRQNNFELNTAEPYALTPSEAATLVPITIRSSDVRPRNSSYYKSMEKCSGWWNSIEQTTETSILSRM